ncbi:MAG: arylsulfotransferase family protein [Azospirillaceae bacterium]
MTARLPALLLVLAVAIVSAGYGMAVVAYEVFPFRIVRDAVLTSQTLAKAVGRTPYAGDFQGFVALAPVDAPAARFGRPDTLAKVRAAAPAADPPSRDGPGGGPNGGAGRTGFLAFGGPNQYLDLCPETGCLAVVFDRDGRVRRAVPYRPEAVFAADIVEPGAYPYEAIDFDFAELSRPLGIVPYPDGDLLVVFQKAVGRRLFPFGAGVARIAPDGTPRWFRFDYSHHWPALAADGTAVVPALAVREGPLEIPLHGDESLAVACAAERYYADTVRLIDGKGAVVREYDVLAALLRSPYRAVLQHTTDGCDPTHLNYVDIVPPEAAEAIGGVAAGDLVVSLRNISAFAVLDAESGDVRRLVRGTFIQQHSVQHWRAGEYLVFDNQGGGPRSGPSRVLSVDLASGEAERTLFPTLGHPRAYRDLFTVDAGKVHVSPERNRAVATFSNMGQAVEFDLATGDVLTEFSNVHDVSTVDILPEERNGSAGMFRLFGFDYINLEE